MVGILNKLIRLKSSEHIEQVKFVQFIRTFHPELLCFAIPNGADVSPNQRIRLVHEGMLVGIPDVMLLAKDLPVLAVEFKRPDGKGKISDDQQAMHWHMESVGTVVKVVQTFTQGKEVVAQWLGGAYNEHQPSSGTISCRVGASGG